ncbi:MAG: hypothetical protein A2252_06370 [Elusimicrobia bacterium RIFOXYA2_FULL_39_19]|nr:MAG: hypothetical protein A2252_06370 [Elusimicrobia bacterium RIFOXYA2_FULL_39_19]
MKKNGFILLEVLLSLVILGTVLIVSIQALASYTRATSSAKYLDCASAQSQKLLAQVYLDKEAFSTGLPDMELTNYTSEINETKISENESQYEIIVKWAERGIEKDLKLITCKTKEKL